MGRNTLITRIETWIIGNNFEKIKSVAVKIQLYVFCFV